MSAPSVDVLNVPRNIHDMIKSPTKYAPPIPIGNQTTPPNANASVSTFSTPYICTLPASAQVSYHAAATAVRAFSGNEPIDWLFICLSATPSPITRKVSCVIILLRARVSARASVMC
jgi:hypothetical protein